MKLFKPLVFATLYFVGTANAATSLAFQNAASSATSPWNGVQYKCVEYAKSLDSFLKANAAKYGIKSYIFYTISNITPLKYGAMLHDDYSTAKAITQNDRHIIAVIDGEVFDNHHPKGSIESDWNSKLHNILGTYPDTKAFKAPVKVADVQKLQ